MKRRGRTSIVETGFGAAGVRRRGRVRATAMPHAGFRQEEINVMTWSTVLSLLVTTVVFLPSAQPGRPVAPDSGSPRVVRLTIAPARLDAARSLSLLPGSEQQTDGDGAELYAKAVQAFPKGRRPIRCSNGSACRWMNCRRRTYRRFSSRRRPPWSWQARAPSAEAASGLPSSREPCPPAWPNSAIWRVCSVSARVSRSRRGNTTMRSAQYEPVWQWPGTLEKARLSCREWSASPSRRWCSAAPEDMAQAAGSPNLYHAMQALPHPLIDLNQPISAELKGLDANSQYSEATRNMMRRQMESSFDRVRQLMNRLDGTVAALQYIEALRHHVATHDGSLPARLGDIADVELAADEKSFAYRLDESMATLEVSPPQGGRSKDAVRYEITVAH